MLRESSEILWSFLLIGKFTDFYQQIEKEKVSLHLHPECSEHMTLSSILFFLWGKELLFEL